MMGRHYFGSESDRDPFGLESIIFESANQIARKTDCLVDRRYLDIIAGTSDYCSPDIYKIRVLKVKDDSKTKSEFSEDYFWVFLYLKCKRSKITSFIVAVGKTCGLGFRIYKSETFKNNRLPKLPPG